MQGMLKENKHPIKKIKQCAVNDFRVASESFHRGFQMEDLSISQVINHVTKCSHWRKIYFKNILYKICSPV